MPSTKNHARRYCQTLGGRSGASNFSFMRFDASAATWKRVRRRCSLRTIASKRAVFRRGPHWSFSFQTLARARCLATRASTRCTNTFLVGVYCQSLSKERESDCNTVAASAAPLTSNCLASRARAASSAALMTTASATGSPRIFAVARSISSVPKDKAASTSLFSTAFMPAGTEIFARSSGDITPRFACLKSRATPSAQVRCSSRNKSLSCCDRDRLNIGARATSISAFVTTFMSVATSSSLPHSSSSSLSHSASTSSKAVRKSSSSTAKPFSASGTEGAPSGLMHVVQRADRVPLRQHCRA